MTALDRLLDAAKSGDVPAVEALLREHPGLAAARLPTGESPLMAALYRGQHDVVTALVAAGAPIDVFAAAALGRLDELRREVTPERVNAVAYDGWTPLHLAAFFGRLEAASILLAAGADPRMVSGNSLANTPLHAATAGQHSGVALLLLSRGADPQVADGGGYTPLQIAEQNGLADVVAACRA